MLDPHTFALSQSFPSMSESHAQMHGPSLSSAHTGLIKPSVTGCTEGTAPCDSAVFVFLSQGPVEHMSVAFASSATAAQPACLLSVQIAQSDSGHISLREALNQFMDLVGTVGVRRKQEMQRAYNMLVCDL